MSVKSILVALQLAFFLIATTVIAENIIPEYIEMNTKEYSEHTKKLVRFSHKRHNTEYSIFCGVCHHNSKGEKLDLKKGDYVDKCITCHKETSKIAKNEKLNKKEKIIKYHKVAMHSACKKCHSKTNKSKKNESEKIAPTKCKECHKVNK